MYMAKIAAAEVRTELIAGFPKILDRLSEESDPAFGFLRAAWYRAAARDNGHTLLARRADGSLLAALPSASIGPQIVGARSVPGSYWPFRGIVLSKYADPMELAAMLAGPEALRALAPAWRLGPVQADAGSTRLLCEGAAMAGWTVLQRSLGWTWTFALAEEVANGWPRKSSRKRMAGYARKLAEAGEVTWSHVSGPDWSVDVLDQLGKVEAHSWVGQKTDGSGAKFLRPHQRAVWETVLGDPVLAAALSATILKVGGRDVAFSFDLTAGETQYAIASSYVSDVSDCRAGKLVTYHQLERAARQGVRLVDLGAGDSGYKREMGAVVGSELIDIMFVRSRAAGQVVGMPWGQEPEHLKALTMASPHRDELVPANLRQLALAAALAGSTMAIVE